MPGDWPELAGVSGTIGDDHRALAADLETAVFEALTQAPTIPYTDDGIAIVRRAIESIATPDVLRVRWLEYRDGFVRFTVTMTFQLWLDILADARERYRPDLRRYEVA